MNATSKQTTSYKYKEPAQRVTTNTVKAASNQATIDTKKQFTHLVQLLGREQFILYLVKNIIITEIYTKVNSSINNYIRKRISTKIEEDYTSYFLNMAIKRCGTS